MSFFKTSVFCGGYTGCLCIVKRFYVTIRHRDTGGKGGFLSWMKDHK